jgi:3-methyladenine DNA glycosylase AlkD
MLQDVACQTNKEWFEAYLKHVIMYRGVKTPKVIEVVKIWRKKERIDELSLLDQLEMAAYLIKETYAEDKFSGIYYMEKYLVGKVDFNLFVTYIENLFDVGAFNNWSTTDWLNARVLSPLIDQHGVEAIRYFSAWVTKGSIWQRRSSILCLRACVKRPKFLANIVRVVKQLSRDNERFIQTGIGWVISDLSKSNCQAAEKIVEDNFECLSIEVIRRHTKYLPKHRQYIARKKSK